MERFVFLFGLTSNFPTENSFRLLRFSELRLCWSTWPLERWRLGPIPLTFAHIGIHDNGSECLQHLHFLDDGAWGLALLGVQQPAVCVGVKHKLWA